MISDTLGDMLARIKNAYLARHQSLEVSYSRVKENLAKLLVKGGYLEKVNLLKEKSQKIIQIELKYEGKKAALDGVKRISKPGLRIYLKRGQIPSRSRHPQGVLILSTAKGLLTGQEAKKKNLGGELICEVW